MSAVVSLFPPTSASQGGWSQQELAEFYRVEAALIRAGLRIASEQGLSDEGEPWFVFCHPDGDEIMHFARIDGSYLIASAVLESPARGRDFRTLINQIAQRHPDLLPIPRTGEGTRLSVHPAALLAALVAAAALILSPSDAFASETDQMSPGGAPIEPAGPDARPSAPEPVRAGLSEERDSYRKHADAILLSVMIFAATAFVADPAEANTGLDLFTGSQTVSDTGSGSREEVLPGQTADSAGRAATSGVQLSPGANGPSGSGAQPMAADGGGTTALHQDHPDLGKEPSKDPGGDFNLGFRSPDRGLAGPESDHLHTALHSGSMTSAGAADADAGHRTELSKTQESGLESAPNTTPVVVSGGQANGSTSLGETASFDGHTWASAPLAHEVVADRGQAASAIGRSNPEAGDAIIEPASSGRHRPSSDKRAVASERDDAVDHTAAAALRKVNENRDHSDVSSSAPHRDQDDGAPGPSRQASLKVPSSGDRDAVDDASTRANNAGPHSGKDADSQIRGAADHDSTRAVAAAEPDTALAEPGTVDRDPSGQGQANTGLIRSTGEGRSGENEGASKPHGSAMDESSRQKASGDASSHSDVPSDGSESSNGSRGSSSPLKQTGSQAASSSDPDAADGSTWPTASNMGGQTAKDEAEKKGVVAYQSEKVVAESETGSHAQGGTGDHRHPENGQANTDLSQGGGKVNPYGAEASDTAAQGGPGPGGASSQGKAVSAEPAHAKAESGPAADLEKSGSHKGDQADAHASDSHAASVTVEAVRADANPAYRDPAPDGPPSAHQGGHGGQSASNEARLQVSDEDGAKSAPADAHHLGTAAEVADALPASPSPAGFPLGGEYDAAEARPPTKGGTASHGLSDGAATKASPSDPGHTASEAGTSRADHVQAASTKAPGHIVDAGSGDAARQSETTTHHENKVADPVLPQPEAGARDTAYGPSTSGAGPDQLAGPDRTTDPAGQKSPAQSAGSPSAAAHDQTTRVSDTNTMKPLTGSVDDGGNLVFSAPNRKASSGEPIHGPAADHEQAAVGLVGVQEHGGVHHLEFHS
jgi:collagen type I/II/III/V/XI/XXIV/XXVII alpha